MLTNTALTRPQFCSQKFYLAALWPCARILTFLRLSFLTCRIKIILTSDSVPMKLVLWVKLSAWHREAWIMACYLLHRPYQAMPFLNPPTFLLWIASVIFFSCRHLPKHFHSPFKGSICILLWLTHPPPRTPFRPLSVLPLCKHATTNYQDSTEIPSKESMTREGSSLCGF